jgi:hypothetical protein
MEAGQGATVDQLDPQRQAIMQALRHVSQRTGGNRPGGYVQRGAPALMNEQLQVASRSTREQPDATV